MLDTPENRTAFDDLSLGDLLVTNGLPENNPNMNRPGAILQGIPVSTNSHAEELAKELGLPLGYLHSAHETLAFLNGQIVVFEIEGDKGAIRLPNEKDLLEFEADSDKDKQLSAFNRLVIPQASLGEDEPLVLNFNEIGSEHRTAVGPKAARLGQLKKNGFYVPGGFVITYKGYQSFLEENQLDKKIDFLLSDIDSQSPQEIERRLREIREGFIFGKFPKKLMEQIKKELEVLGEVALFARSSSNVEDLPGASNAGGLESYGPLSNNHTIILSKARDVMLSLWQKRAFNNRKNHGVKGKEHAQAKVAVPIQIAVDAKYSGLFSTHYQGDPNQIDVTIDEKIKGGVEDLIEGRTAPNIIYNKKSGKLIRKFSDHPLYWEDKSIGIAALFEEINKLIPRIEEDEAREIVLVLEEQGEEALKKYLEALSELDQFSFDSNKVSKELATKLLEINRVQASTLFGPLFDIGQKMEEKELLSPLLVEFAINKEGIIFPLQKKGHEGARKISFNIKVLNQEGMHLRPITSFFELLEGKGEKGGFNYLSENKVYFHNLGTGDKEQIKNAFSFMMLELSVGSDVEVMVVGKDSLEVGRIIRSFFMNLSHDYEDADLKALTPHYISWEKAEEIFSHYIDEDDTKRPVVWDDMNKLQQIYNKVFAHTLRESPTELESAI